MTISVTLLVVTEWTETVLLNVLGFALVAGLVATTVAFGYRAASARAAPIGVGVFVGVAVIAGWLNAVGLGRTTIVDGTPLVHYATATYFLGAVVTAAVTAEIGRRIGDGAARDVFGIDRVAGSGEIASLVRSARLPTLVQLPDRIDDADGYQPAEPRVKRDLAGRTLLLPRTGDESALQSRLSARLERDYDLGRASITLGADGTIERLSVGRARSGVGSGLPPGTVAMAIRAQSAPIADVGDPIEIWTTTDSQQRLVATGTLRATAGDIATVVVDADAADRLVADPDAAYRLATGSAAPTDGYALCAVLRATDETVRSVVVEDGGPLDNVFVGWLSGTVLVVDRDDEVIPFPDENETLRAGDGLSILAIGELATDPPGESGRTV